MTASLSTLVRPQADKSRLPAIRSLMELLRNYAMCTNVYRNDRVDEKGDGHGNDYDPIQRRGRKTIREMAGEQNLPPSTLENYRHG